MPNVVDRSWDQKCKRRNNNYNFVCFQTKQKAGTTLFCTNMHSFRHGLQRNETHLPEKLRNKYSLKINNEISGLKFDNKI